MSDAINNIKIPKKGRPKTDSQPVMVRLPPLDAAAIDDWRGGQRPIPSRPEAIRRLVQIGLESEPIIKEMLDFFEKSSDLNDPEIRAHVLRLRGVVGSD